MSDELLRGREAYDLLQELCIDPREDIFDVDKFLDVEQGNVTCGFVLDDTGSAKQSVDQRGARYDFLQLNYCRTGDVGVLATRMIAVIQPGDRTEVAIWSGAAREKPLKVHQGVGWVALANQADRPHDVTGLWLDDHAHHKSGVVKPGTVYVIEAATKQDKPLVVSGFYSPPVRDWGYYEAEIPPGRRRATDPATGIGVHVPSAMYDRYLEIPSRPPIKESELAAAVYERLQLVPAHKPDPAA